MKSKEVANAQEIYRFRNGQIALVEYIIERPDGHNLAMGTTVDPGRGDPKYSGSRHLLAISLAEKL